MKKMKPKKNLKNTAANLVFAGLTATSVFVLMHFMSNESQKSLFAKNRKACQSLKKTISASTYMRTKSRLGAIAICENAVLVDGNPVPIEFQQAVKNFWEIREDSDVCSSFQRMMKMTSNDWHVNGEGNYCSVSHIKVPTNAGELEKQRAAFESEVKKNEVFELFDNYELGEKIRRHNLIIR